MKFSPFKFILFSAFIVFLTSCLGTTNTATTISSDATFVSLTLAKNDSVKSAVFTLVGDTIVNLDSLPYKTKVDSVYPTFSFKSTVGIRILFPAGFKKDSVALTGNDTINFTQVVRVRNLASDNKATALYYVKVNVHKVEPKLYVWNKLNDIAGPNAPNQKTIVFNDKLFYYSNDGTGSYLYTSIDGNDWSSETVTGLPASIPLSDMIQFNGKLYLSQDGYNIYSSTDGITWTKFVSDYNFKSMLYVFGDKLWAVVQSSSETFCRFASFTETDGWVVRGEIPANFPVRDFTSVTFSSRTGKPKVLLIGGYPLSSELLLKNRWSSEDGVYWVDFSISNHSLDTLAAGASVISYGDKLLLFGVRSDSAIYTSHFRQSIDEGLSWQRPDTLYNRLRQRIIKVSSTKNDTTYINYQPRNYQSVVVLKSRTYNSADTKQQNLESNRIFMVGGKTQTGVLYDVWTGKLNSKSFLLQ
jgi:hypothetical protein